MMMVELASVPSASLPLDPLADHLRLSSGFADDSSQDPRLENCIRAALASIEARTGKALFQRQFMLTATGDWGAGNALGLPIAPVVSVNAVRAIARLGEETLLGSEAFAVLADTHRPRLVARSGRFPPFPREGYVEIELTAGYGTDWAGLPPDLQEAVLCLAAEYYIQQSAGFAPMPSPVASLIAPYRHIRLGGARS